MSELKKLECPHCGHCFTRNFGVDVNGHATFHCNVCGKERKVDLSAGWEPIPNCGCGGTFDAESLGLCPKCGQKL